MPDSDTLFAALVLFSDMVVPFVIMCTLLVYVVFYIKRYRYDLANDAKRDAEIAQLDAEWAAAHVVPETPPKLKKSKRSAKHA